MLVIGNHRLTGEVVHLKRPLAVMDRYEKHDAEEEDHVADMDERVYYEVTGVIRRKYLFKRRPETILRKSGAAAITSTS